MNKLIEEYNKVNSIYEKANAERETTCKKIYTIAKEICNLYSETLKEYHDKNLYPCQNSIVFSDNDLSFGSYFTDISSIDKNYITFFAEESWRYGGHAEEYIKIPTRFFEQIPTKEDIKAEYDKYLKKKEKRERVEKLEQLKKLQEELGITEPERE